MRLGGADPSTSICRRAAMLIRHASCYNQDDRLTGACMTNPLTWTRSVAHALQNFGLVDGSRFLHSRAMSKLRPPAADETLTLRVPGIEKPVCIRAAEGDYYVLRQVLLNRGYADPSAP